MRRTITLAALLALHGCGGDTGTSSSTSSGWKQGVYEPSSTFAAQCASPRIGNDPSTGKPYADKAGSAATENLFLRSWTNELYLWYREVPDPDPSLSSTANYFNLLKTSATTPSGRSKDRFHFTYPTADWIALSQSGVEAGYGAQWVVIASAPPRKVVVAYTEPGSPAAGAGLARGAQVLTVDGADLVNGTDSATVNAINAGLFPSAAGASHSFSILDLGASSPRTVTMVSANVTSTPVQNVTTIRAASGTVGLHAVQRPHRDSREAAGRRVLTARRGERQRPRARRPLQRRRLPGHRERGGLHDRRPGRARRAARSRRRCSTTSTRRRIPSPARR